MVEWGSLGSRHEDLFSHLLTLSWTPMSAFTVSETLNTHCPVHMDHPNFYSAFLVSSPATRLQKSRKWDSLKCNIDIVLSFLNWYK